MTFISILDVQYEEVVVKSQTNKTNGGKGGRPQSNHNRTNNRN
jgi:hypothetical protein